MGEHERVVPPVGVVGPQERGAGIVGDPVEVLAPGRELVGLPERLAEGDVGPVVELPRSSAVAQAWWRRRTVVSSSGASPAASSPSVGASASAMRSSPYWRIESSTRCRVTGPGDVTSRLCSARRASPAATAGRASSPAGPGPPAGSRSPSRPATVAAASAVNGAANTDTRRSST